MNKYFLIFSLIFLTACSSNFVDKSIDMGLNYLDNSYDNYNYDDPYLQYIYPGESLNCYYDDCFLTYRTMDAYFNLYFIKNEFKNYDKIDRQLNDAEKIFNSIKTEWENGEIYNARKSTGDGFALDTYCIFSYVEKDEKMNQVILRYLDGDEWGINTDTIGTDNWREIADETWCIRALMNTEDKELIQKLIDKQIKDTDQFLIANSDWDNSGVLYHMLYVIYDYENKFSDSKYQSKKIEYSNKLANILKKEDNLLVNANSLDVLSKIKYNDKILLETLSKKITDKQKPNGAWDISQDEEIAPVFVTFRAIIALNSYKNEAS